jgi:hypothetical protein
MQPGTALETARLRGAELGELAMELVEDLSGRILQASLANATDDADRKGPKDEGPKDEGQPFVDSTQIFGIKVSAPLHV